MTNSHIFVYLHKLSPRTIMTVSHFERLTVFAFCIIIIDKTSRAFAGFCRIFTEKDVVKMGKIDMNKKFKEDSLLNTAFSLFTTKGVSKTSISDIVNNAGVAKGTFYLYFKDKYDIRNKLIAHKSSMLFRNAIEALNAGGEKYSFNDRIIFIVDNIINQLNENKSLLNFIAKNLSWGVFKHALINSPKDNDVDFKSIYDAMLEDAPYNIEQPEIMIFMIVELVSSTCYSSILYDEPVGLEDLKPYLYKSINNIIDTHVGPEKNKDHI